MGDRQRRRLFGPRLVREVLARSWSASPRRLLLLMLLVPGVAVARPLSAVFIRTIVDGAIDLDRSKATLAASGLVLALLALYVLGTVIGKTRIRLEELAGHAMERRLLGMIAGTPSVAHFDRPDLLDKVTFVQENYWVLGRTVGALLQFFGLLGQLVLTGVLLGTAAPELAATPLVGLLLLTVLKRGERLESLTREETTPLRRRYDRIFEWTTSPADAREIRTYGLQRPLIARFDRLALERLRKLTTAGRKALAYRSAGWLLFSAGFVAALARAAVLATDGRMSLGEFLLTITLVGQTYAMVSALAGSITAYVGFAEVVDRQIDLEDDLAGSRVGPGTHEGGAVSMAGVTFAYPATDATVLSEIDLAISPGETVALVGPNGAGKSTLVKLICGLYEPTSGELMVGANGLEEWRGRVAAVFQDYAKPEFTLRESVGIGEPSRIGDEDAVMSALADADAMDVLDTCPDGLDSQLGAGAPKGVSVSEGQWQKIAVARAGMRTSPDLLVVDEPTASLDASAELALLSKIRGTIRAQSGRTAILLVTHRLATARLADRIIVLEGGRVLETGSHDALVAAGGRYAALYERQREAYQGSATGRDAYRR